MFSATANAKLNLYLHIQGKRDDGYHMLESLVAFTHFGDQLTVETHSSLSLSVTGEFAKEAGSDDNLVMRAAHALQETCNVSQGARITLTKNIPVGAGLGGGSADAAATLKLLSKLWAVIPSQQQLHEIAVSLGADVPMCLVNQPLIASGIGDEIMKLTEALPELYVVLVYPRVHLATPDVYKRYTHEYEIASPVIMPAKTDLFLDSLQSSRNQLQRAAITLAPEVAEVLLALEGYPQARLVRMCGSGSSCFALCDNADSTASLLKDLRQRYPDWWVEATTFKT